MRYIKRIHKNFLTGKYGFLALFAGFILIVLNQYLIASLYLLVLMFLTIYVIEDTLNTKGKIERTHN